MTRYVPPSGVGGKAPDYTPDKDGFVNVSPEYRNFANDTDDPWTDELEESGDGQDELPDSESESDSPASENPPA